jgi:hypothetical protein
MYVKEPLFIRTLAAKRERWKLSLANNKGYIQVSGQEGRGGSPLEAILPLSKVQSVEEL